MTASRGYTGWYERSLKREGGAVDDFPSEEGKCNQF
jgi:hypothetical protein